MFKELITGRKDFNELVVQFKALETIEEKREFYSVLKMEMIKK